MNMPQSDKTALQPKSKETRVVTRKMANLNMNIEKDTEKLPPFLRLPVEVRLKIYDYYVFDYAKNQPPSGSSTLAWCSPSWDMQNKSGDRSYLRPILLETRILLNVCRSFRDDLQSFKTPMSALVLNVQTKEWKSINPILLGSVWVRVKTSDTITAAKIRVMEQVEGLSGCVISGGKEHHFGVMFFTGKPELGAKVFKKDVRIGFGRRILGDDLGIMMDRPVEGVGRGIPVGPLAGLKVKRMFVRDRSWD